MGAINNFFESSNLFINFLFFILGMAILIKGSDFFIDSAIIFARKFKISEVIIGLTLVSIGTSLPELATNVSSAFKGRTAIAIGNIAGSNITNIALILGLSAVIVGKIAFDKKILTRDSIFMVLSTILLLAFSFFFDKELYTINKIEASILLLLAVFYTIYLFKFRKEAAEEEEQEHETSWIKNIPMAVTIFLVGLLGIYAGSEVMVGNVISIAKKLNIADGVIGATIVALGTSFPELAVTTLGVIKKKHDIALGTIVGSNIYNILLIIGITGIIKYVDIINIDGSPDMTMLFFTLPVALLVAVLLPVFMSIKMRLSRTKGIIFMAIYIAFIILNYTGIPYITK